jgi:hypothetical protein
MSLFPAAVGGVLGWHTWTLESSYAAAANAHSRGPARGNAEYSHVTNLELLGHALSSARDTIPLNGAFFASAPLLLASEATDPPPSPSASAPSLLEMLEGRESDMAIWLAIALASFLLGWIVGSIHAKRRERSRRIKLRF